MLTVAGDVRIFVCTEPADMRRSFDGLCGMAVNLMQHDPLCGHLFLFRNRNRDRLKILWWDRDGLAIFYKRLESGSWQFPSDLQARPRGSGRTVSVEITHEELSLLLRGIDLRSVRRRRRYVRPQKPK